LGFSDSQHWEVISARLLLTPFLRKIFAGVAKENSKLVKIVEPLKRRRAARMMRILRIREDWGAIEQNTVLVTLLTQSCNPRYPRFNFRFIVGCGDYGVARKPWNAPPASVNPPTNWPRLLIPLASVIVAPGTSIVVKLPLSRRNRAGRWRLRIRPRSGRVH
jgi:hypothetical protein